MDGGVLSVPFDRVNEFYEERVRAVNAGEKIYIEEDGPESFGDGRAHRDFESRHTLGPQGDLFGHARGLRRATLVLAHHQAFHLVIESSVPENHYLRSPMGGRDAPPAWQETSTETRLRGVNMEPKSGSACCAPESRT